MILINKNASNTVVLTLTELCTLTTPYFLFRFISEFNNTEKLFVATDTSDYTYRYNKFTIIENVVEDLLNGTVSLDPQASWRYEIYEQSSSTNLLLTNVTSLVEKGKVLVIGTPTTIRRREQTVQYKGYGI